MRQSFPDSFATRSEAEKAIARRGLVLTRKASRRLGRWHIVDNPSGAVSVSQFIQLAIATARAQGLTESDREIAVRAAQAFRDALRKRRKK